MVALSKKNTAQDIYPLSPMQEGMLFHHLHQQGHGDHITQGVLVVKGNIDANILEKAFQNLVNRHDILRTVFLHSGVKKPRQVVVSHRKAILSLYDLSSSDAPEWCSDMLSLQTPIAAKVSGTHIDEVVNLIADENQNRKFDFQKDILLRLTLIRIKSDEYRLVITNHHIILDGWSLSVLLEELIEYYWSELNQKPPSLKPAVQFKEYIKWVSASNVESGYNYFEKMLADFKSVTSIPKYSLYDTEYVSSNAFASYDFSFNEKTTLSLSNICRENNITFNSLVQGIWSLVLRCYSFSNDVVFGNVISGRSPDIPGIENMVGMTINTLPLRVKLNNNRIFLDVVKELQIDSKITEKYSYLQQALIQKQVRNNAMLFDHILSFENYPSTEDIFSGKYADIGFNISGRKGSDITSYDLNVTFIPGRKLALNIIYNTAQYSENAILGIIDTLQVIVEQLLENPTITCGEFQWLPNSNVTRLMPKILSTRKELQEWACEKIKCENPKALYAVDRDGKELPHGALGFLCMEKTGSRKAKTDSFAILLDKKRICISGHVKREIKTEGFCFSPEIIEASVKKLGYVENCFLDFDSDDELTLWVTTSCDVTRKNDITNVIRMDLSKKFPSYALPVNIHFPKKIKLAADSVIDVSPAQTKPQGKTSNVDHIDDIEVKMKELWLEVLGVENVISTDDFFLKGGDSLLAIRFTARARKTFTNPPAIDDIFAVRTFGALVDKVRNDDQVIDSNECYDSVPISMAPEKSFYCTSSQQQRMYSIQALDPKSLAYNMPDAFVLRGELDIEKLNHAFRKTIQKHEILRTSFHLRDNLVIQKVHSETKFNLVVKTKSSNADIGSLLNTFVRPFVMDVPELLRAELIIQSDKQSLLLLDMHHIVTDGVSVDILVKDLADAYLYNELAPVALQYKDYCEWQELEEVKRLLKAQREYWIKSFEDEIPVLNLPTDSKRKPHFSYSASKYQFDLGYECSDKISEFCQCHKITPYMFFMAVYNCLLSRYSNQNDIIVGTPVAGRTHQDIENTVGMFVNTLVIKQHVDGKQSFVGFLESLRKNIINAFSNQNYPLEELIAELNPPRDLSRNALFDVLFVMEDKKQPLPQFEDLSIELIEFQNKYAKFDLILAILNDPNNYTVYLEYASELYKESSVQRFGRHYLNFINVVLENEAIAIDDVEILCEDELHTQLCEFNDNDSVFDDTQSIISVFESVAEENHLESAVHFLGQELSYSELNRKANQLARWLRYRGVQAGDVVALMMNKSIDMIVSVYAVLKTGAAYVPIGIDYPRDRVKLIMAELDVALIICSDQPSYTIHSNGHEINTYLFSNVRENLEEDTKGVYESGNLEIDIHGSDLAYVIYTSGSTGKPKGISIEHRSIVNLAQYFSGFFGVGDKVTQFAPFTFDASAGEILTTLLNGACLHVLPNEIISDPINYAHYINENLITFSALPPPYLANVDFSSAGNLRTILAAGSSSNPEIIEKLRKQLTYVNAYGPTETTVISTEWRSDRDQIVKNCIGRPIINTTVYIMNENCRLQPTGVEGEICIGGQGVARGYVNDPEKTAKQFVENPYRHKEIIYKTGDMGVQTENGQIIFHGRKDDQVKIRGFRIEIAEVETLAKSLPEIDDAHISSFTDVSGNLALCCYFTSGLDFSSPDSIYSLRESMREYMPEYMVPAYMVKLDSFPLTRNGKVDNKKLPVPESCNSRAEYVIAVNSDEKVLVDVWQQVLGNDLIGTTDNFFSLGGDSIKAIQIAAKLNGIGLKLAVGRIFQYPRIRELAPFLEKNSVLIEQGSISGPQNSSPIQQWFFEKNFTNAFHWNQSTVLYSKEGLDAETVEGAINQLLKHHDNLRAVPSSDGMYVEAELALKEPLVLVQCAIDNIEQMLKKVGKEIQTSIDFIKGPLIRSALIKTDLGDYLIIVIHHLLVDGVSWRILFEDFCTAYNSLKHNSTPEFPPKTHSFKQWVDFLETYAKESHLQDQLSYWRKVTKSKGLITIADKNVVKKPKLKTTRTVTVQLDKDNTKLFQEKALLVFNATANDLLLAALARSVGDVFGVGEFLLNLEGHGRESICGELDISRTVGWFTSSYPVRLIAFNNNDWLKNTIRVKETLHAIPNNGIGFGILHYLNNSNMAFSSSLDVSTPDISFNYLGDFTVLDSVNGIEVSGFDAGPDMSPESEVLCAININGSIFEDSLGFDFEYSPELVNQSLAEELAHHFYSSLLDLIGWCNEQNKFFFTPSDFSAKHLSSNDLDVINNIYKLEDLEDIHNLTPLQEGMLFTCAVHADRGDYNIQNDILLRGDLDQQLLREVFTSLSDRHQALRTAVIHEQMSRARQVILKNRDIPFSYFDISDMDPTAQDCYIHELKGDEWRRGFNLATDPLTRAVLVKIRQYEHRLLFMSHHIMMDGWCVSALFGELLELYESGIRKRNHKLAQAPAYSDYLIWLEGCDRNASIRYWREYLNGYEESGGLPFARSSYEDQYILCDELLYFSEEKTRNLNKFATKSGLTLNSIMQAIWSLVLAGYNNSSDILFANVISGRPAHLPNVDSTIGLFVNSIPLRVRLHAEQSFVGLALKVQSEFKNSEEHGYVGLSEIREKAKLTSSAFDHVFVFENFPTGDFESNSTDSDLKIESLNGKEQVGYDFNIILAPEKEFCIRFSFNQKVVPIEWVKQVKAYIDIITDQILNNENVLCGAINLLKPSDVQSWKLLNDTEVDFNLNQTVVDYVAACVENEPDNVAVVCKDTKVTYREMWRDAGNLANHIVSRKKIDRGSVIGLMLKRSQHMTTGVLGILRASCAYLPIEPDLPIERINYMLDNADCRVIVTDSKLNLKKSLIESLRDKDIDIVEINTLDKQRNQSSNLPLPDAQDLAYVLYTSGSTGNPKGVMIEHSAIVNRLLWMIDEFDFSNKDVFLQKTAFTFDVSVFELILPFICGARLIYLEPEKEKDPSAIVNVINRYNVSVIHFVPSMLSGFLHAFENAIPVKPLRLCVCSGEALTLSHKNHFYRQLPDVILANLYGPTEAAIDVTFTRVHKDDKNVTIGKPVANTQCYILDALGRLCPVGIQGELHLGGVQLARGYINNDALTSDRFIYHKILSKRLYRTGDLAVLDGEGLINYIGRTDFQVKIRGFRVELGEIENALLQQDEISDALVSAVALADGTMALCAYYTTMKNTSSEAIKARLSSLLPTYMVPTFIVKLERFPLNASGKIDRKNLPNPIEEQSSVGDISHMSEMETIVEHCWREVLHGLDYKNIERLPLDTHFEQLGGHSINAIRISTLLSRATGIHIAVADLYRYSDIRTLAAHINHLNNTKHITIDDAGSYNAEVSDDTCVDMVRNALSSWEELNKKYMEAINSEDLVSFSFSPVQELHIDQRDRLSGGAIDIEYCPNTNVLMRAISKVICSQSLMTSVYRKSDTGHLLWEMVQKPHISPVPLIDLSEISSVSIEKICNNLIKAVCSDLVEQFSKNSSNKLPYRLFIVKLPKGKHQIMFGADHLITDASSIGILQSLIATEYLNLISTADEDVSSQEHLGLYKSYSENLHKGPLVSVEKYRSSLDEFIKWQNKWLDIYDNKSVETAKSFRFKRDIGELNPQAYEIAFQYFIEIIQKVTGLSKIPVTFVVDQRRYLDRSYYNTVGEFLDHVPVICDVKIPACKTIDKVQTFSECAAADNVNFFGLTLRRSLPPEWEGLANELYVRDAFRKLVRFNFYSGGNTQVNDTGKIKSKDNTSIRGILCDVTYSESILEFYIETNIFISDSVISTQLGACELSD